MRTVIILLAAVAAACTSTEPQRASAAELNCEAPPGTEALLDRPERFLVFGEMHGTVESPTVFAEIVCAAAKRGPVYVGVEWPENLSAAFNTYLGSGKDVSAPLAFRSVMEENASFDGRGSIAGLAMYDRLRDIATAGRKITIVAFASFSSSPSSAPSRVQDDSKYADLLLRATPGKDRVLILVGNAHAMREEMTFGDLKVIPMGSLLPANDTLSLNIAFSGGSYWGCANEADILACKPRSARAQGPETPGITIFDTRQDRYDGSWNVGRINASPPAFEIDLPPGSPVKIG